MTGDAAPSVDLRGDLPTGTTVLEASAGTGKTYTIAGYVTRYVAEGHGRLDQVLAVTFGRAATGELRTRVRDRLKTARAELDDPVVACGSSDPVVALLAEGAAAEVAARRDRLAAALASFDAATVATTHEFCQQVLHGLGTAADLDPGTVLVESLDDLVAEVCDDLYLRFYARPGAPAPHLSPAQARAVARAAVADGQALLAPGGVDPDSSEGVRVRFATGVRRELDRRKRGLRLLGFDDLLTRVRDALADPVTGEAARAQLRERYRVVLVDEFQDTDPVQWDVLRLAFHGHRTLVVIGDPKQAIYAFRGADVSAYLAAGTAAPSRRTLDTNWRSDPRLLAGLETLLRGASLGDPRIVVRPVRAGHRTPALGPAPDPRPVRLRVLQREGLAAVKSGLVQVGAARDAVVRDVADQVVALLGAGHTVTPRAAGTAPRPLAAGDVAVLVRTGAQAQQVRDALSAAGVPCVLTGTTSVFATAAARDWLLLLEALEQPHRSGRVRRLALSSLVGRTAAEVDAGGDDATDALTLRLRDWADLLARRGVAALFAAVAERGELAVRLLRRPDGERLLTDLRHVAEALHAEQLHAQLGPAGLLSWLRSRVEGAGEDLDQERSRRLDTDAAAVQVATVHTSKGLEFPVVLVPFGWDAAGGGSRERLPRGHDEQGRRVLFVGGQDAPGYPRACAEQDADDAGEELRLIYVAATRAVSRLLLWWVPSTKTESSPLHRLLLAADPSAGTPARVPVPGDAAALARLRALAQHEAGGLEVETVHPVEPAPAPAAASPERPAAGLAAAAFDRALDTGWRRTSYTGLTRAVHEQQHGVGSEPDVAGTDDEGDDAAAGEARGPARASDAPAGPTEAADAPRGTAARIAAEGAPAAAEGAQAAAEGAPAAGRQRLDDVPSPMASLPGGTAFGTLVHAVLEDADLTAADVRAELRRVAADQLLRRGGPVSAEDLADGLVPAVSTPLGRLADGRRLRDVAPRDRLAELGFELPLAGGGTPRARVRLGDVADLLHRHLRGGDRVAPYAALLASPDLAAQPLRGYLAGSLDAVLRVPAAGHPRYVVVDHKTNRLAGAEVPLTAWHYRAGALDAAVLRAHYPLQALLYVVALHRFLRWRQPGYAPEQHLGGVLYLFLRGMCGDAVAPAADGSVPGVWSWRPPSDLVVALSDLLAGGPP